MNASGVEEALDDVEPADSSRLFQSDPSASGGEEFGCQPAAVRQTVADGASFADRIDAGAVVDEHLQQLELHACDLGVNAGGRQAQRGRSAAVRLGFGIHISAVCQELLGDLDDVRGSLLTEVLDAVRRDVVEQSRAVLARGTSVRELRVLRQQVVERRLVAADDRIRGPFELRDRRVGPPQRFEMPGELRPALEPVAARDEELGIGERVPGAVITLPEPAPLPHDAVDIGVDTVADVDRDLGDASEARKLFQPAGRPGADCWRVARVASRLELLRKLLVLLEVGSGGERKGVGHTKLLSWHAWSPHESG